MAVFQHPEFDQHEAVIFVHDRAAALSAIIAIHDAGPTGTAGGGCRMWPYRSDADALTDALRLSKAMTYKLALAELPAGGAKSVIIGDPAREKTDPLLEAFGRAVERLGGRYIAAEDVGTNSKDMEVIARTTQFVMTQHQDNTVATGRGVFVGLREAVSRRLKRDDLRGLRVAVQGAGAVGRQLCRELAREGAALFVTDLDPKATKRMVDEHGAKAVKPDEIFRLDVDVLAPCALGGILDEAVISKLACEVVAGGANEQLANPRCAELLASRGILYAPDFVINAGGVIGAGYGVEEADRVAALLRGVFDRAERERVSTHEAAVRMAKEKLAEMKA
jgi:leucine dehydrogenase